MSLSFITPKRTEAAGILISVLAAILLFRGAAQYLILAAHVLYLLDRIAPKLFSFLLRFAKAPWLAYVSLGVGSLIAAHSGGFGAVAVLVGTLTTGVGRLFNELY